MADDVALTLKRKYRVNIPVYSMAFVHSVPTLKRIKDDYMDVINGIGKEVY